MALRVRQAGPQDADFLGWVMLSAGRGHLSRGWYDIALGLPDERCLKILARLALTSRPSWWRYDRFLVAEQDGEPAAALAAFGSSEYANSEAVLAEAVAGMGWSEDDLSAVWSRGSYVFSCAMSPLEGEVWIIENVATRKGFRGRGLAGELIRTAVAKGRAAGFGEAHISFLIGNDPAERAYAKAGFALAEERRHADFEAAVGAPGLRRYAMPL
jgi:translation initiation factor 4G